MINLLHKNKKIRSSHCGTTGVLGHRFDPWPGNSIFRGVAKKEEKILKEKITWWSSLVAQWVKDLVMSPQAAQVTAVVWGLIPGLGASALP